MDDKGIKIILEHDMPPQMEQFLAHTIYGSKGKLQYKHKDPAAKLKSIPGKWILHIERKASLLGTAVFIQRNTGGVLSYYVRYVSWSKQFNKSAVLAEIKVQTQLRNTTIRTNVLRLIYQKLNADERPSIMYSYIEEDNLPSFQLATSFGFQKVRTMKTLVYSRFFPKHDPHVRLLMPSEKIAMQKRLCEYYKEYSLFDSSTVFQNGSYYIYEKDGEILAGLKANPNAWSIIHMPGLEGYLIQKVLSKLPFFSKIFNDKEIRFLGFEALWYKDLKDLLKLMEGVSATYNLHMALLWFDRDCNIGKDLERSGQLGLLHKINKSGQAQIICKFNGYSDATIADFMNKPAYVSAFDVT